MLMVTPGYHHVDGITPGYHHVDGITPGYHHVDGNWYNTWIPSC